ncbi:unnamed protein product [Litomosoides sigmodontis]|uniref:Uncharacterized protein n=1 Tax=Litomosoides sigmodontis TaxID=42156 RepID=A0A3P6SJJ6_LITSI|nr:unnamed protein product [Litomosoides sigmodontis]
MYYTFRGNYILLFHSTSTCYILHTVRLTKFKTRHICSYMPLEDRGANLMPKTLDNPIPLALSIGSKTDQRLQQISSLMSIDLLQASTLEGHCKLQET